MDMKCFVINLERANERRDNISEQFNALGIEFELFTAIDRLDLVEEDYERFADRQSGLTNWEHPDIPGALACWMSHQQAWQSAMDDDLDMIAVFEDDVTLSPHIKSILNSVEEGYGDKFTFDLLFLDDRRPHKTFVPLADVDGQHSIGLVKFSNLGTSGYVITRSAIRRLLTDFPRMPIAIDQLVHAGWKNKLQTFTIRPQVVFHGERFVDHGSFICSGSKVERRTPKQKLKFLLEFSIEKRVHYFRRANGYRYS